jgi:hypothetical protein
VLFWDKNAGAWGYGQARGPFRDGRIDAVFNGGVSPSGFEKSDACSAPDHAWTFVRR